MWPRSVTNPALVQSAVLKEMVHKKAKAGKRQKTLAAKQKKRVTKAIKKTKLKKARKERRGRKATGHDTAMEVPEGASSSVQSAAAGDVAMGTPAGVKMPCPQKKVTIRNTAAMNRELTQKQRFMMS